MEKLTIKEFIKLADINILKEVYAKLVALRMEYEIHKTTHFNPEFFELCYHIATDTIKKAKLTKIQLCGSIVHQSQELEQIGFTRQHLLKLAGLDIECII